MSGRGGDLLALEPPKERKDVCTHGTLSAATLLM